MILSESTIHPILLPNQHHFVSLQVLDCHKRIMQHDGVNEALAEFRMTFWIAKALSVMKKLRQCTICTQFNGRAYSSPESPPMPQFRIQECAQFSVGLDNAGPVYVKDKEVEVKVWIALFTCGVCSAHYYPSVSEMLQTFCYTKGHTIKVHP